jgi:hypothetical protein
MRLSFIFLLSCLAVLTINAQTTADAQPETAEIPQDSVFAHVLEHKLSGQSELQSVSTDAVTIYPNITTFITGSGGGGYGWCLDKAQLQRGEAFLNNHRDLLTAVADSLGPDPKTIVSIFRVETEFGSNTETHQVLGAIVSILHYSDDEYWQNWAKDQLHALPRASQILNVEPENMRGSYAGAIGYPQFLPTSVVEYALDGNGDRKVNLSNTEDAIWSIGNYLHENGWSKSRRQAVLAYNPDDDYADCIDDYRQNLQ